MGGGCHSSKKLGGCQRELGRLCWQLGGPLWQMGRFKRLLRQLECLRGSCGSFKGRRTACLRLKQVISSLRLEEADARLKEAPKGQRGSDLIFLIRM